MDEDVDDAPRCGMRETLVMFRPHATTYNYLLHFDDGWRSLVGLPDESVRVLSAHVTHCMCARCVLSSPHGEPLGPDRVFQCPRE